MENPYVEKAFTLFQRLSGKRGTFESVWQDISELILPSYSGTFFAGANKAPGQLNNNVQFDSTGAIALSRFASVIDSLLTPYGKRYHGLRAANKYLRKDYQVSLWLEDLNDTLFRFRYAPQANFAHNNHETFTMLGAFGSGVMFVDKLLNAPGLRYRSLHLGEIFFGENHQGMIDTAVRYFPLSAKDAVAMFPSGLPQQIVDAASTKGDQEHWFIHCVHPNTERDQERVDWKGMAYVGYYVSVTGRALLEMGGFQKFPYAISRYKTAPREVYGRSPAMDVLPALKTLNAEKLTMLKQGQRAADPVILGHDDGVLDSFNLTPGALNGGGISAEGRRLIDVLPTGNFQIGKEMMDDERAVINDAFLVSLFQILTDSPEMTATEVMERVKEKGMLIAPTVGRQEAEYLGPLVERELDLLMQQGLIPPPPPQFIEAGAEFEIVYDSPMSRAMRAEEASGLMRTVESAIAVVNITQDPAPLDHFNWDQIIPDLSDINAVPVKWRNDPDTVAAIRDNRAQQQQTQMMIQAAPAISSVMKAGGGKAAT